ncbi:MAG: hypothetical protein KBC35_03080 [Candidatus Pacebacteria bacterium]|nr:hypothetical protein [Candidatus Paceibacterota bacterium]
MLDSPEGNQGQVLNEVTTNDENRTHRIILYVLGFFLLVIILWGVSQIKIATDVIVTTQTNETETVAIPVKPSLPQEETVNNHFKELMAEEGEVVTLTEEEVKAQLEELAKEETEVISLSEDEIRARLELLPRPDENEEHQNADHVHEPNDM